MHYSDAHRCFPSSWSHPAAAFSATGSGCRRAWARASWSCGLPARRCSVGSASCPRCAVSRESPPGGPGPKEKKGTQITKYSNIQIRWLGFYSFGSSFHDGVAIKIKASQNFRLACFRLRERRKLSYLIQARANFVIRYRDTQQAFLTSFMAFQSNT